MSLTLSFRLCGLLLATVGLSGCVAAALPVVAGGMMAKRAVTDNKDEPTTGAPAAHVPAVAEIEPPVGRRPNLTEAYVGVVLFAIDHGDPLRSVLPDPAGRSEEDLLLPCTGQPPAVLIDLDPGDDTFAPAAAGQVAAQGLAPALATVRLHGIKVLWISKLDQSRETDVRLALANAGLDPQGSDTVLLTRDPAETKTDRRNTVAGEWCITAIVGDRKADFDILMDYLRDPTGPIPFDPLFGNGWFELPPPLEPAAG